MSHNARDPAQNHRASRRQFLASAASVLCARSLALAQDEPTFSAVVNVVNVLATVRTRKNEIVRDLTKDDFVLLENGRPQTIRYFSKESDLPLTIGLMIDTSMSQQRVLDVALAWSVINSHLDVADFLFQHGANINTTWSSHEPASILHELVWHRNYEAMQFLIDRGIDMTIKDHRWNSTAQGWARYAANDEKMAQWLEEAEQQQNR